MCVRGKGRVDSERCVRSFKGLCVCVCVCVGNDMSLNWI